MTKVISVRISDADIMTRSPSRNPLPRPSPCRIWTVAAAIAWDLGSLVDTVPENTSPGYEFVIVVFVYFRTSPAVHCMGIGLISRISG